MPISASQHRNTTQHYQNLKFKNTYRPNSNSLLHKSNYSEDYENIRNFAASIASTHNSSDVFEIPSNQHYRAQNFTQAALPILLLLSQVKNISEPTAFANASLSSMIDTQIMPHITNVSFSSVQGHLFNETRSFKVSNDLSALHRGKRSQDCSFLSQTHIHAIDHEGNDKEVQIIAKGLDHLKCLDETKYKFFKRSAHNAIKILDSAIHQLKEKDNITLDAYLKNYGFIDVDSVKGKLGPLYESMKQVIESIIHDNTKFIYYGHNKELEDKGIATTKILQHEESDMIVTKYEKIHREIFNPHIAKILLTKYFFTLCTVEATKSLLKSLCTVDKFSVKR